MIKIIRNLLSKLIQDIDAGNTYVTEEEANEIIDKLKELANKDSGMSKYQAAAYLNISRASFDNYVREGKLPKGKKIPGFKELRYYKKDLDLYIKNKH